MNFEIREVWPWVNCLSSEIFTDHLHKMGMSSHQGDGEYLMPCTQQTLNQELTHDASVLAPKGKVSATFRKASIGSDQCTSLQVSVSGMGVEPWHFTLENRSVRKANDFISFPRFANKAAAMSGTKGGENARGQTVAVVTVKELWFPHTWSAVFLSNAFYMKEVSVGDLVKTAKYHDMERTSWALSHCAPECSQERKNIFWAK